MKYPSKLECWQKILKFDCIWVTIDFWPSTINFWTFEQLTEQTSSARLENWHGWSWEHIRTLVRIWDPLDSSILMQHETLIWGRLPYERACLVNPWTSLSNLKIFLEMFWEIWEGTFWGRTISQIVFI